MLSIEKQIADGRLVCPITHQRLSMHDGELRSLDGRCVYPFVNGVPVLLDPDTKATYLSQLNGAMKQEYAEAEQESAVKRCFERLSFLGGDYRSKLAQQAFQETVVTQPPEALCVSVGGGPRRIDPNLVNLNIDLFPNVDVVGDAYHLPYADGKVDSIYCEAVLEHLEYPNEAVKEMYRVLRPGGRIFSVTPFLQRFHGYPNHYQNFTLVGHQKLLSRAGFQIISTGVCVGPTFALLDLMTNYSLYLPGSLLRRCVYGGLRLLSVVFRPLDHWLNRHPEAHVLASTTFVYATKE